MLREVTNAWIGFTIQLQRRLWPANRRAEKCIKKPAVSRRHLVVSWLPNQPPDAGNFEQGDTDAGEEVKRVDGAAAGHGRKHQAALAEEDDQRGLLLQHKIGDRPV